MVGFLRKIHRGLEQNTSWILKKKPQEFGKKAPEFGENHPNFEGKKHGFEEKNLPKFGEEILGILGKTSSISGGNPSGFGGNSLNWWKST